MVIFGLFLFLLMLTAGGLGVDFMRWEEERSRLQSTLDRAVLAAASMDQELDAKDVVLDYFAKSGLAGAIGENDITVDADSASKYVYAEANLRVGTTFLQLIGMQDFQAVAAGAAEESMGVTEISLVLDVSGSMTNTSASGVSRIAALRDAATRFVNITMCNPASETQTADCPLKEGKVSMNIVPYSDQVLLGEGMMDALNTTTEQTYSSCVEFYSGDFGSTEISNTTELQRAGHFDAWLDYDPSSNSSYSTYERTGAAYYWTCRNDAWRTILPLAGSAQALRNKIGSLQAGGQTSIDIGMKWGAALLDPAMRTATSSLISDAGADASFTNRPFDYKANGNEKVIVLMTDGVNTAHYYLYDEYLSGPSPMWKSDSGYWSVYNPSTNQYYWVTQRQWSDHPYGQGEITVTTSDRTCDWVWVRTRFGGYWDYRCTTTYHTTTQPEDTGVAQLDYPTLWAEKMWTWYTQFSWLSEPGTYVNGTTKDNRMTQICDAAKAKGITVYTIGFETDWTASQKLATCASSSAHAFNATGLSIANAFASIAREITKLRLVN